MKDEGGKRTWDQSQYEETSAPPQKRGPGCLWFGLASSFLTLLVLILVGATIGLPYLQSWFSEVLPAAINPLVPLTQVSTATVTLAALPTALPTQTLTRVPTLTPTFTPTPPERYLIGVSDNGKGYPLNAVLRVESSGGVPAVFARNSTGLVAPFFADRTHHGYISPGGRHFALGAITGVVDNIPQIETTLYSVESIQQHLLTQAPQADYLFSSLPGEFFVFSGFSADGERYAYTQYDKTAHAGEVHVVDMNGSEVGSASNVLFQAFVPGQERLVVLIYGASGGFSGLQLVDYRSGGSFDLVYFDGMVTQVSTVLSPDGTQLYYSTNQQKYTARVPIEGGKPEIIDETESFPAYFTPRNELVIIEPAENSENAGSIAFRFSLMLYNPDQGKRTVQAENLLPFWDLGGGGLIHGVFSPNGTWMAYQAEKDNRTATLFLTRVGENAPILLGEGAFRSPEFSPDNQYLAYIQAETYDDPAAGRLFLAAADGSTSREIDSHVSSCRFSDDGRYLVYAKVTDLGDSRYQSEILRLRLSDLTSETLTGPGDGLYLFLKP